MRCGTMLFSGRWSCITSSYVLLEDPDDADEATRGLRVEEFNFWDAALALGPEGPGGSEHMAAAHGRGAWLWRVDAAGAGGRTHVGLPAGDKSAGSYCSVGTLWSVSAAALPVRADGAVGTLIPLPLPLPPSVSEQLGLSTAPKAAAR